MFPFDVLIPSFPVKAIIFEKREGAIRIRFDECVRIKMPNKFGYEYYLFKNTKHKWKPFTFDTMYVTKKGRSVLLLESTQDGEYSPLKLDDEGKLNPLDKEVATWLANQIKTDYETMKLKPPNWFEKYGHYIFLGAILTLMAMFGILTWISLPQTLSTLSHIAEQNLLAIQEMTKLNALFTQTMG